MKADYNDISKTYDKYRSFSGDRTKQMVELGGIRAGTRVLDLGCGTGNVATRLLEIMDVDITGIDSSIGMLKQARDKSLEVVCSDIDNRVLPFRDSTFDTVTGAYVIHHICNLEFLFTECYRVLRDGALLLLTSSHEQIERSHPVVNQFFPSYVDIDKRRFPDLPAVNSLLHSAGFREIRHKEVVVENITIDAEYLQGIKDKYVSTYHLMSPAEFELGVQRLEAFIADRSQPAFTIWRGTLMCGHKRG
jgi:ubiquinone/menaquinone biosynthesis C-methylase UbiE